MRIGILGPLQVLADGGAPVPVGGARLRALLTLLATEPGAAVPTERIIDALWEDAVPAGAPNALQSLVSRLRAAIGRDAVESPPGAYRLAVPPESVDAHEFEARVRAARRAADPAGRSAGLRAALALWRGPALAGAAGLRFADAPTARLDALRRAALEERLDADLALGRHAEAIPELQALAADDPLREPVTALLMRALYAAGRQADALARYQEARRALGEGLGVDPSPELEAVHLAVLRQDPSLLPETAPAPPPVPAAREGGLPARLTSFIGRTADLGRVDGLLARARLVTLTGPGGSGKTRLALEAAERVADRAPDGVRLISLAPVTDPAEVPAAAATALGLREMAPIGAPAPAPDPVGRLVCALSARRLLLVLDNCEHVLDAAARLAGTVLEHCPGVRILATSREPLGITGETLWPVEPLEAPPPDAGPDEAAGSAAVRLFADRAAAVSPGFAVTAATAGPVVRICRALDGMPLAIELAAARLRAMTPGQVADRLDDRFRLLAAGSRTAMPRHRTLRGVVEWSWDLLDGPERTLWRRLAVFPGGATVASAEAVCAGPGLDRGDVLDVLTALVDKSLLAVAGPEPRYRMLETIRAYSLERLAESGEEAAVRRAHAEYFTGLAEEAEPHLYRAGQLPWLRRLTAESGNTSAALRWTISAGDAPLALRLCAALGWYWFLHGRLADAAAELEEILALPGVPEDRTTARALALGALASLDEQRGGDRVPGWLARARRICGGLDRASLHPVLRLMLETGQLYVVGWDDVPSLGNDVLLTDPDPWVRGIGHFVRGQIAHNFGRVGGIEDDFAKALAAFRECGDRWGLSFTLTAQAEILGRGGDHSGAAALYEEALRLDAELGGGTAGLQHVRIKLANELDLMGERDRAVALLHAAMRDPGAVRGLEETAALHYRLGEIARRSGDTAEALRRLEHADALTEDLPGAPHFRAMVLCARAQLDMALDSMDEGTARLDEALRNAVQAQDYPIVSHVLAGQAERARLLGDPVRAAELLGTADALRGTRDLSLADALDIEAATRADLGGEAFTAAYDRGRTRTFQDVLRDFAL
ncbi:winged helix-turn-helix domain-containing protein [Actinomadura sp. NAK00032]|uniref:BTAD domain-containing putative transcriptional regulator n=1 Tax=Actinomadura sp. NAK00032 TaxID=2742128 RepID=UPI0015911FB7|nr:BTAD domain-containing putative transcriptional regulator [Actinomadura sp. NAK00032]QKW37758.1 winged helix-turn-helix domain-containing protein [Actinomadura sp. NAK00032]